MVYKKLPYKVAINECLELLLDFPTSFTMSKEAVENEKDIIVSELLMYKDDPNDKVYRALMNALYKEHPLPNRDEFRKNFKKKYGKYDKLEQLIISIENYQFKKYGQTLNSHFVYERESYEKKLYKLGGYRRKRKVK